jgi:UTP-glucose-1-phosphate uridylyltransferase
LLKQARDGCVIAYKFKGRRFDCGTVDGYVAARTTAIGGSLAMKRRAKWYRLHDARKIVAP